MAIRILLVEDEGIILMMTTEGLQDEGYEVVEARDGDEAIHLLDTAAAFDAIVTDVRMPGSADGIDVASHARRLNPEIPVIVVSGYANYLMSRLAAFDPPAAYVGKPYALPELVAVIRRLTTAG